MKFDATKSFEDNLRLFREEVERLDAECALILFANLDELLGEGANTRDRAAIEKFNSRVLEAILNLPDQE